jgi:leader peptidase (prepilin peptidase) / N-methyltransferase
MEQTGSWSQARACPRSGLQPWPVWGPQPAWLPPETWRLGLATCLAGALVGAMLAALVHCGFGPAGQGNICLLAMAGAFLGWQPALTAALGAILLAALLAPLLALFRASVRVGLTCSIGLGVLAAWFGWPWLGPLLYPFLFDVALLPWGLLLLVILPLVGLWLRLFQRFAPAQGPGSNEKPRQLAAEVQGRSAEI